MVRCQFVVRVARRHLSLASLVTRATVRWHLLPACRAVQILVDADYAAAAGWRIPMTVISPQTVRHAQTILANTTLGLADASELELTVRFFAPQLHIALGYDVNVSLLTAVSRRTRNRGPEVAEAARVQVNDEEFDSVETVRPTQFRGTILPSAPQPVPAPPPPCTPAKNTSDARSCLAGWHCEACRVGATDHTGCMSCAPGYAFDRRSSDCSGVCTAPAQQVRQQTLRVAGLQGRFAQVVASVALRAGGGPGVALALRDFEVVATLAGGGGQRLLTDDAVTKTAWPLYVSTCVSASSVLPRCVLLTHDMLPTR